MKAVPFITSGWGGTASLWAPPIFFPFHVYVCILCKCVHMHACFGCVWALKCAWACGGLKFISITILFATLYWVRVSQNPKRDDMVLSFQRWAVNKSITEQECISQLWKHPEWGGESPALFSTEPSSRRFNHTFSKCFKCILYAWSENLVAWTVTASAVKEFTSE